MRPFLQGVRIVAIRTDMPSGLLPIHRPAPLHHGRPDSIILLASQRAVCQGLLRRR